MGIKKVRKERRQTFEDQAMAIMTFGLLNDSTGDEYIVIENDDGSEAWINVEDYRCNDCGRKARKCRC